MALTPKIPFVEGLVCRSVPVTSQALFFFVFFLSGSVCVCSCNPRVGLLSAIGWMSCSKGMRVYCPCWLWVTHYISLTAALFSLFLSPSSTPSLEVIYKITWMKISISAIVWSVRNSLCVRVCWEKQRRAGREGGGGGRWRKEAMGEGWEQKRLIWMRWHVLEESNWGN